MILFLCYVCPPLAVLLMGRPFSMMFNFFLTIFGWVPGVRHALVLYGDYKVNYGVNRIANSIDYPAWVREKDEKRRRSRSKDVQPAYDSPWVGMGGTKFRRRRR
jgi:uncharacterized membrane protein YqaE (UPF0057 family)